MSRVAPARLPAFKIERWYLPPHVFIGIAEDEVLARLFYLSEGRRVPVSWNSICDLLRLDFSSQLSPDEDPEKANQTALFNLAAVGLVEIDCREEEQYYTPSIRLIKRLLAHQGGLDLPP